MYCVLSLYEVEPSFCQKIEILKIWKFLKKITFEVSVGVMIQFFRESNPSTLVWLIHLNSQIGETFTRQSSGKQEMLLIGQTVYFTKPIQWPASVNLAKRFSRRKSHVNSTLVNHTEIGVKVNRVIVLVEVQTQWNTQFFLIILRP